MDKPKYKLLKDLPTVKAGTIFQEITQVDGSKVLKEYESSSKVSMLVSEINNFTQWFEEIQEPTDSIHWKPKTNERYWFYFSDGDITTYLWGGEPDDIGRYELGRVYRTEEECIRARDRELAEARLRRTSTFKPDWKNEKYGHGVRYGHRSKTLFAVMATVDCAEIASYATIEEAEKSIKENEEDWLIYFGIEDKN